MTCLAKSFKSCWAAYRVLSQGYKRLPHSWHFTKAAVRVVSFDLSRLRTWSLSDSSESEQESSAIKAGLSDLDFFFWIVSGSCSAEIFVENCFSAFEAAKDPDAARVTALVESS